MLSFARLLIRKTQNYGMIYIRYGGCSIYRWRIESWQKNEQFILNHCFELIENNNSDTRIIIVNIRSKWRTIKSSLNQANFVNETILNKMFISESIIWILKFCCWFFDRSEKQNSKKKHNAYSGHWHRNSRCWFRRFHSLSMTSLLISSLYSRMNLP